MNPRQFRDYIVAPAITRIGACSRSAEQLLMGTALAESGLVHIQQTGGGPALGVFQMEPATHDDIWENFLRFKPGLLNDLKGLTMRDMDLHEQLRGNLFYAAAMCRIHYLRVREPLPAPDDWPGFAAYWKDHYNTRAGAGTVEGFLQKARPAMELYA
jgi:hypothetical protein